MYSLIMRTRKGAFYAELFLTLFVWLQLADLSAQQDHPGSCPAVVNVTGEDCTNLCSSDTDCANLEKCCSIGCGQECVGALFQDYSVDFTLIKEWSDELNDPSTELYRELATNITKWVECAYNASDFTVTVTIWGFSQTGNNNVSVDLTITAERPVSTIEIVTPLDNYTSGFTVLEMYDIEDLHINSSPPTMTPAPTTVPTTTTVVDSGQTSAHASTTAPGVTTSASTTGVTTSTTGVTTSTTGVTTSTAGVTTTEAPAGCSGSLSPQGAPAIFWRYNETHITFRIAVPSAIPQDNWFGMAISNDSMHQSDIYILRNSSDSIFVEDWGGNFEGKPKLDKQQDAYGGGIIAENNGGNTVYYMTFSRPLATGDNDDRDLLGCHYFVLAQGNVTDGQVKFPYNNKFAYNETGCIYQCIITTSSTASTTSGPSASTGHTESQTNATVKQTTGPTTSATVSTSSASTKITTPVATKHTTQGATDTTTQGAATCSGSWAEVPQLVIWTLDSENITFVISINGTLNSSMWMGLGLSNDTFMPNSDIITIRVEGENATVEDRWAGTNKVKPQLDPLQDVTANSVSIADNKTSVSFTRPLVTGDSNDRDVIGCHYFLFAVGPLNKAETDISYHGTTKTTSSEKICIEECVATTAPTSTSSQTSTAGVTDASTTLTTSNITASSTTEHATASSTSTGVPTSTTVAASSSATTSESQSSTEATTSSTQMPESSTATTEATTTPLAKVYIEGEFKISAGVEWIPELADETLDAFKNLVDIIVELFRHIFDTGKLKGRFLGYTRMGFSQGSVRVSHVLEFKDDPTDPITAQDVTDALNAAVENNQISAFTVEPGSITNSVVQPATTTSTPSTTSTVTMVTTSSPAPDTSSTTMATPTQSVQTTTTSMETTSQSIATSTATMETTSESMETNATTVAMTTSSMIPGSTTVSNATTETTTVVMATNATTSSTSMESSTSAATPGSSTTGTVTTSAESTATAVNTTTSEASTTPSYRILFIRGSFTITDSDFIPEFGDKSTIPYQLLSQQVKSILSPIISLDGLLIDIPDMTFSSGSVVVSFIAKFRDDGTDIVAAVTEAMRTAATSGNIPGATVDPDSISNEVVSGTTQETQSTTSTAVRTGSTGTSPLTTTETSTKTMAPDSTSMKTSTVSMATNTTIMSTTETMATNTTSMETTTDSMESTSVSMATNTTSMETTTESMETTSVSMATNTTSMETTTESMATNTTSVEITTESMGSTVSMTTNTTATETSSTTVTPSTSVSTTAAPTVFIKGRFKITDRTWDPAYNDLNSTLSKNLSVIITRELKKIFGDSLIGFKDMKFTEGSVKVEYTAEVNKSPVIDDPAGEMTRVIREAQQNNQIEGFSIASSTVQNELISPSPTSSVVTTTTVVPAYTATVRGELTVVNGTTFREELLNSSSPEYLGLEAQFNTLLRNALNNRYPNRNTRLTAITFSKGSVIVTFTAEIDDNASSPVTANGVVEAITTSVNSGEFGNMEVDMNSITAEVTSTLGPSPTVPVSTTTSMFSTTSLISPVSPTSTPVSTSPVSPSTTIVSTVPVSPTSTILSTPPVSPTSTVASTHPVSTVTTIISSPPVSPTTTIVSSPSVSSATTVISTSSISTTAVVSTSQVSPTITTVSTLTLLPSTSILSTLSVSSTTSVVPTSSVVSSPTVSPTSSVVSSPTILPTTTVVSSPSVLPTTTVISPTISVVTTPTVLPTTEVSSSTLLPTSVSSLTITPTTTIVSSPTILPTTTVFSSPTVSTTTEVVSSLTVLPTTTVVSSSTVLPTSTVVSSSTILPTTTVVSSSTILPTTTVVSSSTILPTTTAVSSSTSVPTTTVVSSSTILPTSTVVSSSTILPTSTVVSSSTILPTTTVVSSSTILPTTTLVSSSTILPTTTIDYSSTILPTTTVVSSSTILPTTTLVSSSTILPTTTVVLSSTIFPTTTIVSSSTVMPSTSTISPTPTTTVTPSATVTPTTTPTPKTLEFYGTFTITTTWDPNLSDTGSPIYQTKKTEVENGLNASFMSNPGLKDRLVRIKQMVFVEGSIKVNYVLVFTDNDTAPIEGTTITQAVNDGIDNNAFPTFDINKTTVIHQDVPIPTPTSPTVPTAPSSTEPVTTTTTEKPPVLPHWAIAVIACGAAVLLFLVVMICILCRRRHVTHKYALEDPDDIGYRRQFTNNVENHPQYAYDNKTYDDVAGVGELKDPAQYYNLSDTDFKEGNGQAPTAAANGSSSDPNKTTIL